MRGVLIVIVVLLVSVSVVHAQDTATPTPTNTPEPTFTPAPVVAVYDTIYDQPVQIAYSVTAGDVMVSVLLLLLLFSLWGFGFIATIGGGKRD
jgi:hypothetical protein